MPSKAGISFWLLLGLLGWLSPMPSLAAQETQAETPALLLTAIGLGHPPRNASSPTQAKAMAERGAFVDAIRKLAQRSGRAAPLDYRGPVKVGAAVKGFRITKVARHPDGTVEVEVALSAPAKTP
ncbi:MAG: hypothetical protein EPO61_13895 [Nitrospirae bacterium]|nr:MAG: hypothetical protein EPO61_13895 [Nitrospirota bacterium]